MQNQHPANQAPHKNQLRAARAVDRCVAYSWLLKFIGWMTAFLIVWITPSSVPWRGRPAHLHATRFVVLAAGGNEIGSALRVLCAGEALGVH
jgi:hypothetical protein